MLSRGPAEHANVKWKRENAPNSCFNFTVRSPSGCKSDPMSVPIRALGLALGWQLPVFEATLSHDTSIHLHFPSHFRLRQSQLLAEIAIKSFAFSSLPSRAPHELFINITDSLPRPCQRPRRASPSTPARHPRRAQPPLFPSRHRTQHIARLRVAAINRAEEAQLALLLSAQ